MNSALVLGRFIHGLVFFTFSLMAFSLHYRSHRILLARQLQGLGLFAICEAVGAWHSLFAGLTPQVLLFPTFIRPVLLGSGYIFLIVLGVQTFFFAETAQAQARRWLAGFNVVWIVVYFGTYLALVEQRETVVRVAEGLVHIVFGVPGSLLAAVGLRRQSYRTLDLAVRKRIQPYLRLFEITAGLLSLLHLLYLPWPVIRLAPAIVEWLWGIIGIGLTVGISQALNTIQLEVEHWIEGVERLQALAVDRERIGRDLHDGIIQSLYAAGLLLESVQPIIPSNPMRAQAQLGRVIDNLNETIQDIRRYIFDLRSDMPDDDLPSGIKRLLRDFHINTLLETEFEVTGVPVEILSMERRRHIFQIVRETLANTARHARARWVKIQLNYNEHALDLTISDDGIGMETLQVSKGYGLRNIRERVRLLDGTLRIESAPNEGVTYHLTVPY